jgi:hypothetical protein
MNYNLICDNIEEKLRSLLPLITGDMSVDDVRPLLRGLDLPEMQSDFFCAFEITQVITRDDEGVKIAEGVPLTFGPMLTHNVAGAFGSLGPVTHQVRRMRVIFATIDERMRTFIHAQLPSSVFARLSHCFEIGFGALPGPVGLTIV